MPGKHRHHFGCLPLSTPAAAPAASRFASQGGEAAIIIRVWVPIFKHTHVLASSPLLALPQRLQHLCCLGSLQCMGRQAIGVVERRLGRA
jgi:hypothetical protein